MFQNISTHPQSPLLIPTPFPIHTHTLLAERASPAHSTRRKEEGRKSPPAPTHSSPLGTHLSQGPEGGEEGEVGGRGSLGTTRLYVRGAGPAHGVTVTETSERQSPRNRVLAFPKCLCSPGPVSMPAWPLSPARLVVILLGVQLLGVREVLLHAGSRAALHLGLSGGCSQGWG